MALSFSEFKQMFVESARRFKVEDAPENEIKKSYRDYEVGVKFTESAGTLKFFKTPDGQLSWSFKP